MKVHVKRKLTRQSEKRGPAGPYRRRRRSDPRSAAVSVRSGPMGARVLLIEGYPGCGKSTTAQWLNRQRHAMRPTRPGRSTSPTVSDRLGRWRSLAVAGRSSDTVHVLESAWLQVPLFVMLRQDLDPGVIRQFIDKTTDAMSAAAPVLIYLSQPDPEAGMRALMQRRGMSWGLGHVARSDGTRFCANRRRSGVDGLMHYWSEHNRLAEAIVRAARIPTIVLSAGDGDWPVRRAAILRFLEIDGDVQLPSVPERAERLVGAYRHGASGFTVTLDGHELVVDRLLWPRNRLLPVSPDVYEMESWPVVLTWSRRMARSWPFASRRRSSPGGASPEAMRWSPSRAPVSRRRLQCDASCRRRVRSNARSRA